MIRKVMIEVDENDLDDFIERGIVRADVARNATLMYESDDCINRQSVHDYISKNEYGAWVELPESTMHKDINKLPSVILKNKWIKVEDGLPEENHAVLVYCPEYNNTYIASLYWDIDEDGEWYCWYYYIQGASRKIREDVIAWMPIPEYKEGD